MAKIAMGIFRSPQRIEVIWYFSRFQVANGSKLKQMEANGSKLKQTEANGSKTKQNEANGSKRRRFLVNTYFLHYL